MSTRVLIILSLLFIVVAGYFYASNDTELTTPNLMPSDIDYQASRIKALQTNDQGTVSYQLTADKVVHYQNAKTALLTEPRVLWQVGNDRVLTLTAASANLNETAQVIRLQGDVTMVSQPAVSQPLTSTVTGQQADQGQLLPSAGNSTITVTGRDFVGNLVTKQVTSQQPIVVTQANNRFESAKLNADVGNGNYQFERVEMTFQPAR